MAGARQEQGFTLPPQEAAKAQGAAAFPAAPMPTMAAKGVPYREGLTAAGFLGSKDNQYRQVRNLLSSGYVGVEKRSHLRDGACQYGELDYQDGGDLVKIKRGLPEEEQELTLIHETFHIFNNRRHAGLSEDEIEQATQELYSQLTPRKRDYLSLFIPESLFEK